MNPEELKYHITLQEVYKKKMGELQIGDRYYLLKDKELMFFDGYIAEDRANYLYIPLPIDPINEKRGLMGMIKNFMQIVKYSKSWAVALLPFKDKKDRRISRYYAATTPTLALLKTLAEQEGVEVE